MVDFGDKIAQQIAFSQARGINGATAREMLERIGNLSDFFTLTQAELHNLTGCNSEIYTDQYRNALLEAAEREAAYVRRHNIDVLFIDSEEYPRRLSACEDAPVVLFKLGSCNLDSAKVIGIVGTRHATHYGIEFTNNLVMDLASKVEGIVVVSGLAYGIDVTAHKAAMASGIPTVGVLGQGYENFYPAEHRMIGRQMLASGGAVVSEYTSDAPTHRSNFLSRNRIIAGLCDCILVVESDYRGGSMSTARIAQQYNRDVFALPGRVTDKYSHGTNQLISNHTAALIQSADDIIELMNWPLRESITQAESPTLFRALSKDEQRLLEIIKDNPELTINDLCVRLNMSYSALSDIIFKLELDDIITTLPGGRYAISSNVLSYLQ